jgi:hypothetical protein
VLFDRRTLDKLKQVDIEDLEYEESDGEEDAKFADGDIVISKKARAREAQRK